MSRSRSPAAEALHNVRYSLALVEGAATALHDPSLAGEILDDAADALADAESVLIAHRIGRGILAQRADPNRRKVEGLVRHLVELGPRATGELLDALARRHDIAASILGELETYGRLTREMLTASNANEFPARPLHAVGAEHD